MEYKDYLNEVARGLSRLRAEYNFTLYQLSARTGLSHTTISTAEKGEKSPNLKTLFLIAQAYDVSVSYLINTFWIETKQIKLKKIED